MVPWFHFSSKSHSFISAVVATESSGGNSLDRLGRRSFEAPYVVVSGTFTVRGCTQRQRNQSELLTRQLTSTWRRRSVLAASFRSALSAHVIRSKRHFKSHHHTVDRQLARRRSSHRGATDVSPASTSLHIHLPTETIKSCDPQHATYFSVFFLQ